MDEKLEVGKNASSDLNRYVKELARSQLEFVKSFGKLGNALDERLHYGYEEEEKKREERRERGRGQKGEGDRKKKIVSYIYFISSGPWKMLLYR